MIENGAFPGAPPASTASSAVAIENATFPGSPPGTTAPSAPSLGERPPTAPSSDAASPTPSTAGPGPNPEPPAPAGANAAPRGRRRVDRQPGLLDVPAPGKPARRRVDREALPPGEVVAGRRVQRARDPEARRRDLAAAALEVITEAGLSRTTHRAVAARAGLPLGATTYYFPTLDDLIAAGLQLAAAELRSDLVTWAERLRRASDVPATLAALIGEYLADRRRAQIECEMYVAAGRDVALRPLATAWISGLRDLLEPHVGAAVGRDLVALLDGVMLHVLITGEDLDTDALTATIRRMTSA